MKHKFTVPDPAAMRITDNALLLHGQHFTLVLPDDSNHETCVVCTEKPSNHMVGDRRLCCDCYVDEGHPPADWHRGCMARYERIRSQL